MRCELQRLLFGPQTHDVTSGLDLMQVEVSCPGNAEQVHMRAVEALTVIFSIHEVYNATHEEELNPRDEHESDALFQRLESWFGKTFKESASEEAGETVDEMYWFNEGRDWFWWDARVSNPNLLYIYVTLEGFPVSGFDLLRRLLYWCGATQVEQGDAISPDDIPARS